MSLYSDHLKLLGSNFFLLIFFVKRTLNIKSFIGWLSGMSAFVVCYDWRKYFVDFKLCNISMRFINEILICNVLRTGVILSEWLKLTKGIFLRFHHMTVK